MFFDFFWSEQISSTHSEDSSANAASIEASFPQQICGNSDQNSFDSPNSWLSPRRIYLRSIDSSLGLHRTNFAINLSYNPGSRCPGDLISWDLENHFKEKVVWQLGSWDFFYWTSFDRVGLSRPACARVNFCQSRRMHSHVLGELKVILLIGRLSESC